ISSPRWRPWSSAICRDGRRSGSTRRSARPAPRRAQAAGPGNRNGIATKPPGGGLNSPAGPPTSLSCRPGWPGGAFFSPGESGVTTEKPARPDEVAPTRRETPDDEVRQKAASSAENEGTESRPAADAARAPDEGGYGDAAQRLAEAERKLAEANDRYLRAVAELENVRRRAQEEVARAQK